MGSWTGNIEYLGTDITVYKLNKIRSVLADIKYLGETYIESIYTFGGIFMLKRVELILFLAMIAALVLFSNRLVESVASREIEEKKMTIVIDAGHGGSDPGKVGVNGALEKDINLKIAVKVKELLEANEMRVIMTREEDQMLGSPQAEHKKLEDMKERVALIHNAKADFAVSIHQNSYTDDSVSGAQVFYYSDSQEGKRLAENIQDALLRMDESNKRQAKGNDTYYLLKHVDIPTVIVECGFLSNQEEAEKLMAEEYQVTVANAIVEGIESCFVN